jgi:hypothetical protein
MQDNNLPLGHQSGANMRDPQNPFPDFNAEYDDFIGKYTGVFDAQWCADVVDHFKYLKASGHTFNRQFQQHQKHRQDDESYLTAEEWDHQLRSRNSLVNNGFNMGMEYCLNDYMTKFSILQTCQQMKLTSIRIQETGSGGGFHSWHSERQSNLTSNRKLVTMVYLNTIQNGGETEFLYQAKRIKPEQGLALIWPADFTHTHRGNPPLAETKYIVTSWFEFA